MAGIDTANKVVGKHVYHPTKPTAAAGGHAADLSYFYGDIGMSGLARMAGLQVVHAYYYITGIPADFAVRLYSTGTPGVYVNNGFTLNSGTPRVTIPADGTYLFLLSGAQDGAALSGSYNGVMWLQNGSSWYTVQGVSTANTKNNDGFPFGTGSSHLVLTLNAGTYFDVGVFETNGRNMYVVMTVIRLPI